MDALIYLQYNVKVPISLNILDLIFINPDTMDAYKWAYTDAEGLVRFEELSPFPFQHIAKSLLESVSPAKLELPEYRRIVNADTHVGKPQEEL